MKKHEIIVITLLVAAVLSIPAGILWNGLSDAAERDWRNRPYEGTLAEFQQEHMALLMESAEILWRHEDDYASLLDEWDEEWQLYRSEFGGECRDPYTEAEWSVLQRVFGEQMCSGAVISWWHTPHLEFRVDTAQDGHVRLIHIPEDGADAAALLAELQWLGWDVKKTAYPDWYAAKRID